MNLIDYIDYLPAAAGQIPFLNLQYVYCYIVSLFGGQCVVRGPEVPIPSVEGIGGGQIVEGALSNLEGFSETVSTGVTVVPVSSGGGFWSWLWPFGSSEAGEISLETGAGAVHVGAETSTFLSLLPGPVADAISAVGSVLSVLWDAFSFISYSFSALLFLAIIAAFGGIVLLRMYEWAQLGTLAPRKAGKSYGWSRWQDLLDGAMSAEPRRWRSSIVAADDMLGELFIRLGYIGETTDQQLRSVPEGAFITLGAAWEAHRIKNFVTHKESDFILTQSEAFRVMKLYEQVFEEFDFI